MPLLVGLVHVALIWPRYHVGSFDDDASYILTAKALLAGQGLTGHLTSGEVVVGLYPPGYSALLVPLVWLWPHSFLPLRLFSTACFAAVFPLMWVYLDRRGVAPRLRTVALLVLALGPPFATYGSMVMAEAPFLVALMLLLLAVDRWRDDAAVLSRAGGAVVVLSAALVWLKQAGVGLVAGLFLWLLFSRTTRGRAKALLLAAGLAAALVPVVAARLATGIPLAGARYSEELGGFYQGGLVKRVADVLPHSAWHLLSTAIPATVVPYLEPLPIGGSWPDLWKVLSWQVTVLAGIGSVVWARRHRDAAGPMAVVYLIETMFWPFVNERRAILVLPLLVGWYVVGAAAVWAALHHAMGPALGRHVRSTAAVLAVVAVLVPLVAQAPRDYLFGWGQSSSHFGGSRYVAVLRHLGTPAQVVETDYRSSTALFSGHQTNWSAFVDSLGGFCYGPGILQELVADHAAYLLIGDVNKPGAIDSSCLQSQALLSDWAVPILHTARDNATVYELVGPYTGQPGVANVLGGAGPGVYSVAGRETTLTWDLSAPAPVSQLSLGEAAAAGPTGSVRLEVEGPGGTWAVVASSRSAVGDGSGTAPYLMARWTQAVMVRAVRVVVDAAQLDPTGPDPLAAISDVAALGPSP